MLHAKIPSTGEELLRVGLGTYRSFDKNLDLKNKKELSEVLNYFLQQGGKLIDSSPMYGQAESVVGQLSTELKINQELFIATKVWVSGKENGEQQIQESFKKMGRTSKKIELMQIHNLQDWKTHLPHLRTLKQEGKINYIGITHYSESAFSELEKIIKTEKDIDFLQIPYCLGRTGAEHNLIPAAADKGVAVIANEPFGQGALFKKARGKAVPAWAQELNIKTWSQYFLKFILGHNDIQFVIPATGNIEHMKDNMSVLNGIVPSKKQREQMFKEFT